MALSVMGSADHGLEYGAGTGFHVVTQLEDLLDGLGDQEVPGYPVECITISPPLRLCTGLCGVLSDLTAHLDRGRQLSRAKYQLLIS